MAIVGVVKSALASSLVGAVLEEDAMDIDVHLLLQSYLRLSKMHGLVQRNRVKIQEIERQGSRRNLYTDQEEFAAPIIVNAAGAWADEVASLAGVDTLGLKSYRRTAFTFAIPHKADTANWPHISSICSRWYL